jgi:YD repeat-containing protein
VEAPQYHALCTDLYDAADLQPGPHQGTYASTCRDGHGRTVRTTERIHVNGAIEARHVQTKYLPTGEPEVITRARGSDTVARWMLYDSLGRMVLNVEPNTSDGFFVPPPFFNASQVPDTLKAWRYAYNDAGDLVGTSDARGCGVDFYYDAAGRLLGEDYFRCEDHHPQYSPPQGSPLLGQTGGLEVSPFKVTHM